MSSEVILVDDIPSDTGDHNGGDLHFGGDGMLYASTGDGGTGSRIWSQDLDSLGGKLLRVDPATGLGPSDNPFVGASAIRQRVWAYGLRNPFRFGIDPERNASFIGDVGEDTYEEIDRGIKGANYGWPQVEGPRPAETPSVAYPRFWYSRSGNPNGTFDGCSAIIGGAFVRGTNFPTTYAGSYFFGDWTCGRIWSLAPDSSTPNLFTQSAVGVVKIGFGPDGLLYFTDLLRIHRIRLATGNRLPMARANASPITGRVPLTVTFSSTGSSDPDHEPLIYHWDFGDSSSSSEANPRHTYARPGMFTAVLTVMDSRGARISALPVTLMPGNTAPTATITEPADGTRVRIGTPLKFEGVGLDAEDGTFPNTALAWSAVRWHGSHANLWAGGTGTQFVTTMPEPEDLATTRSSYLETTLTATDRYGAIGRRTIRVYPETVELQFRTEPAGLRVTLDGVSYPTPITVTSAKGARFDAATSLVFREACLGYEPTGWTDGGAPTHLIVTPDQPATYTATFALQPLHCVNLPILRR